MCAGEQRYLIIPSSLGYGRQGYSDVIPPNATLRFEIEMVEIEEKVQIEVSNRIPTENCMMKAENGDTVQVHYNGTLTDGSQFDSSYNRGEPYVFELGSGYVIKGWEQVTFYCFQEKIYNIYVYIDYRVFLVCVLVNAVTLQFHLH